MENTREPVSLKNPTVLQSQELHEYILKTSVYPREPNPLKELRIASANHPMAFMGTAPDAGQLMTFLLKLVNPKKTIEIGVFTGYSLLLTALTIPDDGKITAIDINRKTYEIGLPVIKKARVEHKIDFIESQALPILDKLLEDPEKEGSFDFAFVDADKNNYWNYHQRLMKLIKTQTLKFPKFRWVMGSQSAGAYADHQVESESRYEYHTYLIRLVLLRNYFINLS
ncbi:unnamed protein product [Prunus armeniaca]